MNTRTISLDIDKRHAVREPITIAQGDKNGTTIVATIYDGGTLVTTSGLTARFRMRLPDGRHFYEKTATWNAASGTATVTIDETQAASAPGTTSEAYFELLSGTTVIHSTSRFSVRVLRSATEGFDPATSYSDRVEELLDGLDELPLPGNAAPVMDGTASVGTSGRYARQDHRHPTDTSRASTAVATTSANGLMSAADKTKLDGIATNANAYELPPATASALGGVKPDGTTITVDSDGTIHGAPTYELPTMSASTKGGAKLGDGLALTDGALGIDPEPQESTGEVRGAIASLTAKGWATQDGTPTPESPVSISVADGHTITGESGRYVSLIITHDGITTTIPVPLPSKGYAAALPDGTADVLTIDGAGKVEWESATGMVTFDGSESWVVGGDYKSTGGGFWYHSIADGAAASLNNKSYCDMLTCGNTSNATDNSGQTVYGNTAAQIRIHPFTPSGQMTVEQITSWLAENPVTVLYPLATPVTEQRGYLDWPSIPDGAVITCPELDALGVRYLIGNGVSEMARDWYERAKSEYEGRILALEQAVAELATA